MYDIMKKVNEAYSHLATKTPVTQSMGKITCREATCSKPTCRMSQLPD